MKKPDTHENDISLALRGIEYRQMCYYLKVIDCQSFSKAAAELYVSQPLISQCVTNLESLFGCRLLIREKGKVRPTAAGKVLEERAREIVNMVDNLTFAVRRAESVSRPDKEIGVAMSHDIPDAFLTEAVFSLKKTVPRVVFHLYSGATINISNMIYDNKVDAGIITSVRNYYDKNLDTVHLGTIPLVFAAAESIIKESSRDGFLYAAKRYPAIIMAGDNSMHDYVMKAYASLGIIHDFEFCSSVQELINRIQCGMGITILPAADRQYWNGRGIVYHRIEDADLYVHILAIRKKESDPVENSFLQIFRDKLKEYSQY